MSADLLREAARTLRDDPRERYDEALADWLDETARWVPIMEEPLAVADAVLGGGETHKSTTTKEKS